MEAELFFVLLSSDSPAEDDSEENRAIHRWWKVQASGVSGGAQEQDTALVQEGTKWRPGAFWF